MLRAWRLMRCYADRRRRQVTTPIATTPARYMPRNTNEAGQTVIPQGQRRQSDQGRRRQMAQPDGVSAVLSHHRRLPSTVPTVLPKQRSDALAPASGSPSPGRRRSETRPARDGGRNRRPRLFVPAADLERRLPLLENERRLIGQLIVGRVVVDRVSDTKPARHYGGDCPTVPTRYEPLRAVVRQLRRGWGRHPDVRSPERGSRG